MLGLYRQESFRVVRGNEAGAAVIRQARWYFANEIVAVANDAVPVSGFARGVRPYADIAHWARDRSSSMPLEHPPLVWVAAPDVVRGARLSADATSIIAGHARMPLALTPKIALNRSYFDASSAHFFAQRAVKLRGGNEAGRFVARTLWPEDFALPVFAPLRPLAKTTTPQLALRARVREAPRGGAQSPFDAWTLWRRGERAHPGAGARYVLALILSGAQGDDDEAHGGHFALVTGVLAADGAIDDWMVNNFYALDSVSEKGILGAPVPLDNYLADLNGGQAWYRPGALLIAVLREARAAALVQGAMNRIYNHFYRHQLHYDHAAMNCTGISVDTLRTLGLDVAPRKPAWRALAPLALPWLMVIERSVARARQAYDYATEDATRLLPAAAFEEAGAALVSLAEGVTSRQGKLAAMLAEDLDALVLARIPQLPSSRAWGDAPAVTRREYHARLPPRREDRMIVPVPLRAFPAELRDDDSLRPTWRRSSIAIAMWTALVLAAIVLLVLLR